MIDGSRDRITALAALLVCAAAVVPYLPTIDDYFIRDDFGVVQLLSSKPAGYFTTWFHTSWMDQIWGFTPDEVRPFPAISYQLTAWPDPSSPVAHHLLNIALHAANGLLVLAIGLRVARLEPRWAIVAAVVFVLLPVQAESVAWITGRVDSMPAFFYLLSFLLYVRWREHDPRFRIYAAALVVFFVALFTKQNTITMAGTLVAYDLLASTAALAPLWRRATGYLPFVALTLGYLGLRLAMFGQVAREEQLGAEGLATFFSVIQRHLANVVAGDPESSRAIVGLCVAVVLAAGLLARNPKHPSFKRVLFFGPVWWTIGVAPVLVAGYESPRHVYLASVGWAILIGLAFEGIASRVASSQSRRIVTAAAVGVAIIYTVLLVRVLGEWARMGAVSHAAVQDLKRVAAEVPRGTLIIAGAPMRSWEWALPFAGQPPFNKPGIPAGVLVVSPRALHCCRAQWFDDTRRAMREWSNGPAASHVVMLRWDPESGSLTQLSSESNASLAGVARMLVELPTEDLLERTMLRLIESAGPPPSVLPK